MVRTTGAFSYRGAAGYFWSSGAYSGVNARNLNFGGAVVWPESSTYKTGGFSVRCLAQNIRRRYLVIPLTPQEKSGSWYACFVFLKKTQFADLCQARVMSASGH
ncbi:hypothetical protein IKF94_03115 [Candidatus Saccharibacteria bacterium]|nr:hypothetical protein [Candidatus Saccharibacteria bacterium]